MPPPPPSPLPKTRPHLTSLFASFPSPPSSPPPANPLHTPTSPTLKPLLLTLHTLFPTELLPALDLLDRRLVTRLILATTAPSAQSHTQNPIFRGREGGENAVIHDDGEEGKEEEEEMGASPPPPQRREGRKTRTVYYVRSSQRPRSQRFGAEAMAGSSAGRSYEVCLRAWNCSCAAFVFAAFGGGMGGGGQALNRSGGDGGVEEEGVMGGDEDGDADESQGFGGLMRGDGEVPVCKHLLACYLVERWGGFDGCVEERVVGREEMGGWAAGWGG